MFRIARLECDDLEFESFRLCRVSRRGPGGDDRDGQVEPTVPVRAAPLENPLELLAEPIEVKGFLFMLPRDQRFHLIGEGGEGSRLLDHFLLEARSVSLDENVVVDPEDHRQDPEDAEDHLARQPQGTAGNGSGGDAGS